LKGHEAAGNTFKVHLDGFNQLPYLTGQVDKSPRRGFFYFNDDRDIVALRLENWKAVFLEQRAPGTLRLWAEPFTPLRVPKLFDLRAEPLRRTNCRRSASQLVLRRDRRHVEVNAGRVVPDVDEVSEKLLFVDVSNRFIVRTV
jgi:arylsulfatase A-like enzyme